MKNLASKLLRQLCQDSLNDWRDYFTKDEQIKIQKDYENPVYGNQ